MAEYENYNQLKDFVEAHDLMNKHSQVMFNAVVTIKTATNQTTTNIVVRVEFSGYDNSGMVSLHENDLDPMKYPTEYSAKWQTFLHVDNHYLLIKGNHIKNLAIGEYEVSITPINKTRD